MNIQVIIDAWNSQADEFNQWHELDADERVLFTIRHMEEAAHNNQVCGISVTPTGKGYGINEDLKLKMQELMYALTKNAARASYSDFLEGLGIDDNMYNKIKKEWEEKLGVKPYV
jgi:hypothetical protein